MPNSPIAKVRRERGVTQADLARAVGVSVDTIANWDNGRTWPDVQQLWKLAQALNSSPNELCGWVGSSAPDVVEFAELERQKAVCAATLERLRADALEVSEVVEVLEDAGGMSDADLLEAFVGQVWVSREVVRVTLNFDRDGEPARLVIPGDGRVRVSDGWCPSRVFGRTVNGWTLALVDGRVQMERARAA